MSQHSPLDGLREWLDAVEAGRKPDLALLLRGLPGRNIRGARIADRPNDPKAPEGRSLIAFDIRAPKDAGTKTRYMLPVHFAVTRALDTVPGIRLRMHKNRTSTDSGPPRYYVDITIGGRQTNLSRVLFDASANVDLRERKGADHRMIVPATYRNTLPSLRRKDVLALATSDTADLLKALFRLADARHGDELTTE